VIVLTQVIGVEFVEFDGIDALTVLVDQLHHVFEKSMQALALEIKTDQVTRIVPLRLQQFLYLIAHVPMLLFCINLFI
jgi:hypothetical protein